MFDNLISKNIMTFDYAKELLKLPMIVIDDGTEYDDIYTQAVRGNIVEIEALPFDDATYWLGKYGLYRIQVVSAVGNDISYALTYFPDPEGDYKTLQFYSQSTFIVKSVKADVAVTSIVRRVGTNSLEMHRLKSKELVHGLEQSTFNAICAVSEFLTKCKNTERYAVVRTPKKLVTCVGTKTVNKLRQVYDNAPRVCYLRTMPDDKNPTGLSTGIKQKPHQRIKHTKTLMHERYKNHPLFRVKDGIEIQTYWVGEKTAEYQGNIYKLLE
jgi:hypothetical protein